RGVDFFENLAGESDAEFLSTVATRFYFGRGELGTLDLPREVLFPFEFDDRGVIQDLLASSSGRRVATHGPQKGDKLRLIDLANQNARHLLEERVVLGEEVRERADDLLYDLQEALELKVVPRFMVCFDISHLQGSEVVGSAVVFENAEPNKGEYRRFRIRGDWGNDDFRSMSEIVGRYFKRRLEEGKPIPELAVIDGGKGQLAAASLAAAQAGTEGVTFVALAKREEEIYLVGRPEPLRLARSSSALRLLQRVRNEAHRFAHTYNRKLRTKRTLASELAVIPGIGPSRQRALLARFGSVRAVRQASAQEIAAIPGFSEQLARKVLQHLGS
ncbi:MAG TPA: helix-hairpin-helix domain-containing protein, partial [Longimicrobiales bacterium]|nr:helix-hairpin-helix domain-containing protein [Longimicrobiales bacterium]